VRTQPFHVINGLTFFCEKINGLTCVAQTILELEPGVGQLGLRSHRRDGTVWSVQTANT
jgi:hypothetical protein